MPKHISKDFPLSEITLRRYEKPYKVTRREAIRKLCLSLGLLQPGDSRDVIVDVLQSIVDTSKKKKMISSEEVQKKVIASRKKSKIPLNGIAPSNIRRQIKRLKDIQLIENIKNEYRITEFDNLSTVFEERILDLYLPQITKRVKDYCKAIK
ncbi:hypothetical protein HN992_00375 [Candidatus Woesearchaeota archaeon]|jgi:hypothetical protein|nr:hypothetical protein [Candidatus Woesearchaeota archaeon]MBT3438569.1 hypothetical protein [Candidatus Woesearchaeota archaeon]MBT4058309.1 hypothetical protein [Candidatus Woesearchaeota archaeon]MBT4208032.1 hypothetical protein [Candidatus Woesearchaeota archaeon]MBT4732012.1 hypothetical protein [Candidatus Woesearchaeota archaeon]